MERVRRGTFRVTFGIGFWILLTIPAHAQAPRPEVQREICLTPWTEIHRTARDPCWVLIQNTCLDRSQWARWSQSGARCWEAKGPLIPRSRRENFGRKPVLLEPTLRARSGSPGASPTPVSRARLAIEHLRERWDARLQGADPTGILSRLITGTDGAREVRQMLSLLGLGVLTHLLILHWLALASLGYALLRRVLLSAGLSVQWGIRSAQLMLGACAIGFVYLGGASLSGLRPLITLALFWSARLLGLRWRTGVPLGLAWMVEMVMAAAQGEKIDQLETWATRLGFSIAAFGAIRLSTQERPRSVFWPGIAAGCVCSLLVALGHHWLALGGVLVSAALLPLLATLLLPLALIGSVLSDLHLAPGELLLSVCGRMLHEFLGLGLHLILRGPFEWTISSNTALLAAVTLALAWRCSRQKKAALTVGILAARTATSWCGLGASWAIPGAMTAPVLFAHEIGARVEQLDVGQGDAALVQFEPNSIPSSGESSTGLIDAGPPHALAPSDWISLLADRGLTQLSWVALTHLDEDHAGGLRAIADWVPIHCAVTGSGQLLNVRGATWQTWLNQRGISLRAWDGECAPLEVLPPSSNDHRSQNAAMSVIFLPLRGGGFYLNAGDGDAADERRAIPWFQAAAARTPPGPHILKISHHGSRFSSDPRFLEAVSPTEAWISVGLSNTYGHPAYSVLERLQTLGIPVHRTDLSGSMTSP